MDTTSYPKRYDIVPKVGCWVFVGCLPNFDLIKLTSNIKLLPALGIDYPLWVFCFVFLEDRFKSLLLLCAFMFRVSMRSMRSTYAQYAHLCFVYFIN